MNVSSLENVTLYLPDILPQFLMSNSMWVRKLLMSNSLWVRKLIMSNSLWVRQLLMSNSLWARKLIMSNSLWARKFIMSNSLWARKLLINNSLWVRQLLMSNSLWVRKLLMSNSLRVYYLSGIFKLFITRLFLTQKHIYMSHPTFFIFWELFTVDTLYNVNVHIQHDTIKHWFKCTPYKDSLF